MTEGQQHLDDLKYIGHLARKFDHKEVLDVIKLAYSEKEKEVKLPWE